MSRFKQLLPWIVSLLCVLYVIAPLRPQASDNAYNLHGFSQIPVTGEGRVKPLDTVARTSLLVISDRQTVQTEDGELSAIRWLADVMSRPEVAADYDVFRIDDPNVVAILGDQPQGKKRFSFATLRDHADQLEEQAQRAAAVNSKQRNAYQKHLLDLYTHVQLYVQLMQLDKPYFIPPADDASEWSSFNAAFRDFHMKGEPDPAVRAVSAILMAYRAQDTARFNAEVASYQTLLQERVPASVQRANIEVMFNDLQPFYRTSVLYVVVFLLICFSWLGKPQLFAKPAAVVLAVAFIVHTLGLIARMYLQGRPPVTNLYSSAIFIGWGCVILGAIVERAQRNGIGSMLAAVIGFATLIIAHNLADGDSMQMMQAVLDTNFWLATHVVTIAIGYSATFFAGFLGICFIFRQRFAKTFDRRAQQQAGRTIYGVICFALLLSFVGTVLGGIWADQSWGRFWGWDPKENGAALIVLMTALILHARWGGMIQERGMAVLAVAGNIITSWSWFGTNMLGVGLHSYGFMDSAVFWLMLFVLSQLTIMGVGMLPVAAPEKSTTRNSAIDNSKVKPAIES